MSTDAKRRVVAAALLALALWPLCHRLLVLRYDLSPWRFFGWAMYCQPKISPEVDAWIHLDGGRVALEEMIADSQEIARARFDLRRQREVWGTWVTPDSLARRIFEAVPRAERVDIVVRHLGLDPSTARIGAREYEYRLYRDDLRR